MWEKTLHLSRAFNSKTKDKNTSKDHRLPAGRSMD